LSRRIRVTFPCGRFQKPSLGSVKAALYQMSFPAEYLNVGRKVGLSVQLAGYPSRLKTPYALPPPALTSERCDAGAPV
jgi:hypothetical protein